MGLEPATTDFDGTGLRIGIVVSVFNAEVTGGLLTGALLYLTEVGAEVARVIEVPGAFEIPVVARKLALSGELDAIVCLGAVIQGDTDHYEHIAHRASEGVMRVALDTGVPTTFGILAARTEQQALERSAPGAHNKGAEAAAAAVGTALALASL